MNSKLKMQKHAVVMVSSNNNIVASYDSISQAKRKTGFSKSSIYRSIKTNNQISPNRPYKFKTINI